MGSRDLSVISTPPPNRQPIVTESHVFSEEVIRDAVEAGAGARRPGLLRAQPRGRPAAHSGGRRAGVPRRARAHGGHGRMLAEELERLVMDFIYGEFDVLLSTTIVEKRHRRAERQYDHRR